MTRPPSRVESSYRELLEAQKLARRLLEALEEGGAGIEAAEAIEELRRVHMRVSKRSLPEVYRVYAYVVKLYAEGLDSLYRLKRVMLGLRSHRESTMPREEYEAIKKFLEEAMSTAERSLEPVARLYAEKHAGSRAG